MPKRSNNIKDHILHDTTNKEKREIIFELKRRIAKQKDKLYDELKPYFKRGEIAGEFTISHNNSTIAKTNYVDLGEGIFLYKLSVGNYRKKSSLRRLGIGSAFIQLLIDDAKKKGDKYIILKAEKYNLPFYKKLGFRVIIHDSILSTLGILIDSKYKDSMLKAGHRI